MTEDEVLQVVSAAKAVRTESEMLSDLLSRGEVLSDHRLSAHYSARLRAVAPLLSALDRWEGEGSEEALDALRTECILLRLTEGESSSAYAGVGVCVRAQNNIKKEEALALLSALEQRAGLTHRVAEGSDDFFRIEIKGDRAYPFLSAMKADTLGEGVRFAVYPVFDAPDLREEDVRTDVFLNGGKGGQNVNKVETAIRMTHLPTGVTVTCRDERSQLQNKKRAARMLKEALRTYYADAQAAVITAAKRKI